MGAKIWAWRRWTIVPFSRVELESFYQQYYVHAFEEGEQADSFMPMSPTSVNSGRPTKQSDFKVLCTVNKNEKFEENTEVIRLHKDVQEKKHIYVPFNILSLDTASASQSIMQLE